jgi:predicted transposase/invertase (TIGR01784 family)
MTELTNPHDRFFKAVFGRVDVAAEFLAGYLPPAVAEAMEWTTLRAAKESFLDAELAAQQTDLLYEVESRAGGTGYVYLLFEHKSYVEPRIALDLLRYRVRIWEHWLNAGHQGRLPVIVPVVVYHGAATWRVSAQFADGVAAAPALRAYVPECVYHLVDLGGYRDEDLRGAVILQTALLTLKYIFRDELRERLPEILGLLRALEQSSSGLDYLITLLRYLAQSASRLDGEELRKVATRALSGGDELMTTIAEQWVQEGLQRGLQQGLRQGVDSERQLLLRMTRRRFGSRAAEHSQPLLARIGEPEVLEELGEVLLDCADGEAWLAALASRADNPARK